MSSSLNPTAAVAIITSHLSGDKILVLRRSTHPDDPWSGHFSFPGGRKEDSDIDLLATCIRETKEETGIRLNQGHLVATLEPQPAGRTLSTPLWVQPFTFTIQTPRKLELEASEIVSGCWLDIEHFRDEKNHRQVEMIPGSIFPVYPLEDYYLWGFTYRLLQNVLRLDRSFFLSKKN